MIKKLAFILGVVLILIPQFVFADGAIRGMAELVKIVAIGIAVLFFLILLPFSPVIKGRTFKSFFIAIAVIYGLILLIALLNGDEFWELAFWILAILTGCALLHLFLGIINKSITRFPPGSEATTIEPKNDQDLDAQS